MFDIKENMQEKPSSFIFHMPSVPLAASIQLLYLTSECGLGGTNTQHPAGAYV